MSRVTDGPGTAAPALTPAGMAALHALSFTDAPPPWPEESIADLLAHPGIWAETLPGGFAMGSVAGPEAELLTLAVDPARRRQGLGRILLARFEATARARGAEEAFLEVSEANPAARALYAAAGWTEAGRRRGYYGAGARRVDALVLRRALQQAG